MQILFKSRFTPGIKASETKLQVGDEITYRLLDGTTIKAVIASDVMEHAQCKTFGYEAIEAGKAERFFADVERIIDWDGRMESEADLAAAIAKVEGRDV